MKRLLPFLVLVATGCGSTGTDSTGDDDDGAGTPFTCASFTAGAGIICDNTTSPPTIRVDFGTNAGQAVEGPTAAGLNPNKGRYISSFTPTAGTEAISGMLIKNPATGKIGIKAADELCKAKNTAFPNAHLCTSEEVLWNVRNGVITNGMSGLAYGYHQDPGTNGAARNSDRGNCAGLTYNTADIEVTGSRWVVGISDPKNQSPGTDATDALTVNFEGGLPCNTTGTPIACCQ